MKRLDERRGQIERRRVKLRGISAVNIRASGFLAQTPQAFQPHSTTFGISGPRPGETSRGPRDRA